MKAQIGKLVGGNKRKKILQFEIENEAIYMGGKYAILRLEDYNELVNGLSTSDEALHIADVGGSLLLEAKECLIELCQLKAYKDDVGKDAVYQKAQLEAWKRANDVLNKMVKKQ